MTYAAVHFCSASEDESPFGQRTPVARGKQTCLRQCLDPVAALDIHRRIGREHHDVHVGVGSRRPASAAAYECHRAHVIPCFGERDENREEPHDVVGEVRWHDAMIAGGCSFEA